MVFITTFNCGTISPHLRYIVIFFSIIHFRIDSQDVVFIEEDCILRQVIKVGC